MSILSLGYLRIRTPHVEGWQTFAENVLGFMPTDASAQSVSYRWDAYPYRLAIERADEPGVDAVGYEVGDDRDLEAVVAAVEKAGIEVTFGSAAEVSQRQVSGFARFTDPAGAPIELFHGPVLTHVPVVTPLVSGFVTGDMGMGHVVVNVPDARAEIDFYRDVLGFHCRNTWQVPGMSMAFLGCNPRHHTLAFAEGLGMPGLLVHFMVEVATIDDVGYAQDRCVDAGIPVVMGLGRHTNDHMISFYCLTPDGFMVEVGWGGLQITDPATVGTYQITKPSFWGHRPLKA
ncbi:MAG TPA: VOC family protein [Frankiaceae bacterium]|jgi:3,4-dihydroxy-9,10-secoandrosta-1,3,5(10)-triene-9,17-dione 4,5-dioxygenase|nr:VOC family protein [Frankiaceae bacterium]